MRKRLGRAAGLLALWILPAFAGTPGSLEGTWSVPSLSQRATPMIFSLLPDGKATERVGTYQGEGTWKIEGDAARIHWSSGWTGLFRPSSTGGYELATWKKGSPPDGPPDDVQPARHPGEAN